MKNILNFFEDKFVNGKFSVVSYVLHFLFLLLF